MEPPFEKTEGVLEVKSGYTGGSKIDPTYEEVCSGSTGHAEAVQVVFDPNKVSYQTLLEVFWKNIDPEKKDGQFCDIGRQYRTAIFYHNDEQKKLALESKEEMVKSGKLSHIYTEIVPAAPFYLAEDYHQEYHKKNPLRYTLYRHGSGRDQRLKELWGNDK
jgi:peptide-methionine (S)-S-oxide reductase